MNTHSDLKHIVEECVGHPVKLISGPGSLLELADDAKVWRIMPEDPFAVHEFITWHLACNRQWFESWQQAADEYCARWHDWEASLLHNARAADYAADTIEFRL